MDGIDANNSVLKNKKQTNKTIYLFRFLKTLFQKFSYSNVNYSTLTISLLLIAFENDFRN